MGIRIASTSAAILALSGQLWAGDAPYRMMRGSEALCHPFLDRRNNIEYVAPSVPKVSSTWAEYKARCPAFLQKERWMPYRGREFDDYALYSLDIDNDGSPDTVLYRRFDKEHFVTVRSADGREYRKQDGMEITEQFYKVDVVSCSMDPIFSAYEKTRLLTLNGVVYIEHVNPYDRGKAMTIYKKVKGANPPAGPQDALCLFQRP